MNRASSPPDATFISGPGRVPGLVSTQNSTRSNPSGPPACGSLSTRVVKRARSSFRGAELLRDGCIDPFRRAFARIGQCARRLLVSGLRRTGFGPQRGDARLGFAKRRKVGREPLLQGRQSLDGHLIFAGRAAQGEQPLLDPLQFARIEIRRAQGRIERRARAFERVESLAHRLDCRAEQRLRARAAPLQPPQRARDRGNRRMIAADDILRVGQFARDLLRRHHVLPARGERRLLALLRGERGEFVMRVAQVIGLGARRREARFLPDQRRRRLFHGAVRIAHGESLRLQSAMHVEKVAMRRRIDERAVVMLSVDLDQRAGDHAQRLRADGLIVDEGARAPVRHLHAPQHEIAVDVDRLFVRYLSRHMIGRRVEHSRHLPLRLAAAHQRAVAARAEGEREGVEQDRFAGARLAGEHGQAAGELDVQPIDENDVADGEGNEHAVTRLAYLPEPLKPRAQPTPSLRTVLEIHDPLSSCGSSPPVRRSAKAS